MDEPMQDVCADPIKNGAEEAQYVSVEIDTQATDGYDDALLDKDSFKQISNVGPKALPVPNPEPRYAVPLDQDEPAMDFKFAKPAHTTPIFRPARPSANATRVPSCRGPTPSSEICSGTQEPHQVSTTNGPRTISEAKVFVEATMQNNEAEPAMEFEASQRPALKQKDSNAQLSTNIPTAQQKRGVNFAGGSIDTDRQPIQYLRPQQTRPFTSMPLPFPDVQSQTKKIYRSALRRTTPPQQCAPSPGHGSPFGPNFENRAQSPAATGDTDYEQLSSHTPSKYIANQTRRASICYTDNDRIGKLSRANMPFPETTYSANQHSDGNSQRMHESSRPAVANKLGRKRDLETSSPCVNLQSKAQVSPELSPKGHNLKESADGRGPTTQQREVTTYSGQASNLSNELLQGIEAHVEKEKQKLFEQMQEKDAKINEVSKKNEDYEETINELRRTNASLSERFATMREKSDALDDSLNSQLEEHKSLGDFVTKHKSQAVEYRHEAENMRMSLNEAKSNLQSLQLYQQNSKARLEETRVLAISQMESFKSVKESLETYKTKLQEEMEKSRLLQKELKAQHLEEGLKDTIKDLLDSHCLSVSDRLAIQENKLSEAISNTDRENQSRLSDCLRLLESTTGNPPQAPKEVLELTGLIEALSTNISDRLQSADDGSETLRNAGTEVMEALKARVEALFEIQDSRKELDDRISSLKIDNARLELVIRGLEERILELQTQLTAKEIELDRCRAESNVKTEWNRTQLDDRQKEIYRYRENLGTKVDELRKAQEKIESGSVAQNKLTDLQATHAKAVSDLADVTKKLTDCEAALAEQVKAAQAMQVKNADLEERLSSAEQRAIDVEQEISKLKASSSESLRRQRVEAETDRRKSLESEKRSHVQKASNLLRLRVEAEAIAEGLKTESKTLEEDVAKKDQLIRTLETEKATLEGKNKEQAERLAQLDQWSKSQANECHSLTDAVKSTAFDIAQLEIKLKQSEEKAAADSRIVNNITDTVEAITLEYLVVTSRLESYEGIEAKVQDYCRKSGIPFEANAALDAILEILAGSESRTSGVARTPSQNSGLSSGTKSRASNDQATSFTPKVVHLQVPDSPEIPDSQTPSAPNSSPLPRQGVRSNISQLNHVLTNTTIPIRGPFGEIIKKFNTQVAGYRESRTIMDPKDNRRDYPLHAPEIEDSQDKGGGFTRSPSYSPLSETNSSEFDQPDDYYMLTSNRTENKKGRMEETTRGQRPTGASKKADVEPPKAEQYKPSSKVQVTISPMKSCLKQTSPIKHSVDDLSLLPNDTVKTPLSDSTSIKPRPSRQISKARSASISKVQDPTQKFPSDSNLIRGGSTPRSDSNPSSIISTRPKGISSEYNLRKRHRSSASSAMGSEPPTKQTRLSLPAGQAFRRVSPFVSEASKRRESAGPSLGSL
ncbi:hypothetical protein V501_04520 [Pseudogymnoascus sp. VKM F-4519 (FW-2642)]|nr:hypothetical protein V501_04520 [Pseudogymnoascus sp. VKM F-4519 (FW-2642)]